jgi:putative flippase GtrA
LKKVDLTEFSRFVLSGTVAAFGNFFMVWLLRRSQSYEVSVLWGAAAALVISFILSKSYAFGSRSWERAPGEASRFIVVFALGCAVYWTVAVLLGAFALPAVLPQAVAEASGVVLGAGAMSITSYFGHRFFTFRIDPA